MNNIKRRIESLPPIPLDTFNAQIAEQKSKSGVPTRKVKTSNKIISEAGFPEDDEEETISPFQCLFCNLDFATDDTGLALNLEHMQTDHGLLIPDAEVVVDLQSLVGYLATVIRVWHECLYCGAMKSSTSSIQSHMRDKGHCLLNLDREPELLDFWERPESNEEEEADVPEEKGPTHLSATEIRTASGKIISSRYTVLEIRKTSRKSTLALEKAPPQDSEDTQLPSLPSGSQQGSGRQLARREEMSIAGVSLQQRQALAVAEKKAQRSEAVARRAREWVYAKGANSQKFDQVDNQMKWGKQNHKLLPR